MKNLRYPEQITLNKLPISLWVAKKKFELSEYDMMSKTFGIVGYVPDLYWTLSEDCPKELKTNRKWVVPEGQFFVVQNVDMDGNVHLKTIMDYKEVARVVVSEEKADGLFRNAINDDYDLYKRGANNIFEADPLLKKRIELLVSDVGGADNEVINVLCDEYGVERLYYDKDADTMVLRVKNDVKLDELINKLEAEGFGVRIKGVRMEDLRSELKILRVRAKNMQDKDIEKELERLKTKYGSREVERELAILDESGMQRFGLRRFRTFRRRPIR